MSSCTAAAAWQGRGLLRLLGCRARLQSCLIASLSSSSSSSASAEQSVGRSWLKHLQLDSVYPKFLSNRFEVPVYIRIPDVPKEELSTDQLWLSIANSQLVAAGKFDWLAYYDTVHRQLQLGSDLLEQLLDSAMQEAKTDSITFDAFLLPLLQQRATIADVVQAGQVAATLDSSENSVYYARLVDSLTVKFKAMLTDAYQEADYLHCLQMIRNNDKSLTDKQIWLVNKEIRECRRSSYYDVTMATVPSGALSKITHQLRLLREQQMKFDTNVMVTGSYYKMVISNKEFFADYADEALLSSMEVQPGMYAVTLTPGLYEQFMQLCSDRQSRRSLWSAYVGRAGYKKHFTSRLDNTQLMSEQRLASDQLAEQLGRANRSEIDLLARKLDGMPQTVQAASDMLEALKRQHLPVGLDHYNRVMDFANDNGFEGRLEAYDWPYWQRRALADAGWEIVQQLQHEKLRDACMLQLEQLVGVAFRDNQEITQAAKQLYPNHSVQVFDVTSSTQQQESSSSSSSPAQGHSPLSNVRGRLVWLAGGATPLRKVPYEFLGGTNCASAMFLDTNSQLIPTAYAAWDEPITDDSRLAGVCNRLAKCVQLLCGHPMMGMYFSEDRSEARLRFVQQLLHQLIMLQPTVLKEIVQHAAAGQSELHNIDWESVCALLKGQHSMQQLEQLYRSAYELEMWSTDANWRRAQQSLAEEFLPFFSHSSLDNEWPCSATSMYGAASCGQAIGLDGVYDAAVAADCAAVLMADREAGARFCDSFLDTDSGHSFVECFRRFSGRDTVLA